MKWVFLSLSCFLPLMSHPLSLGVLILVISSVSSAIIGNMLVSWFGYSLFLIYVGGILVMFSYVVALSPNFSGINHNFFLSLFLILSFLSFLLFLFLDSSLFWDYDCVDFFNFSNSFEVVGLFFESNFFLMIFVLMMLLATMVMVVKVCFYRSGPLRPFS